MALEGADPYVGRIGELHHEPETRIDVMLPSWLRDKVERALLETHPYEVLYSMRLRHHNRQFHRLFCQLLKRHDITKA